MMWKKLVLMQLAGLCAALLLFALLAPAQQSLGDYARKQRELKAAAAKPKATKVYTNDDLPKTGGLSTSDQKPAADKEGKAAKEGEAAKEGGLVKPGEAPEAKAGEAKPPAEDEKAWRDRFEKLRKTISEEERRLDLYQRELNQANIQYYSNPDQALREQTMRTEIDTRTKELEQQKAAVEAARRALADAEEELRKKGLPPGWAR